MQSATLEHANITVTDPQATASWMQRVFGWKTRWEGESINGGHTLHVGGDESYIALYRPPSDRPAIRSTTESYFLTGGLNHLAVIVSDFEQTEQAVRDAGFTPGAHQIYEPGRRFYFHDNNGIEFEVVSYD